MLYNPGKKCDVCENFCDCRYKGILSQTHLPEDIWSLNCYTGSFGRTMCDSYWEYVIRNIRLFNIVTHINQHVVRELHRIYVYRHIWMLANTVVLSLEMCSRSFPCLLKTSRVCVEQFLNRTVEYQVRTEQSIHWYSSTGVRVGVQQYTPEYCIRLR